MSYKELCSEDPPLLNVSERLRREWIEFEKKHRNRAECLTLQDEFLIVPKDRLNLASSHASTIPAFVIPRTPNQRKSTTRYAIRPSKTSSGPLAAFKIDLPKTTGITDVKVTPVWSRSFGDVIANATPERSCASSESVIWRKDGSALRLVCLDGVVATVLRSSKSLTLAFLEVANGDAFSLHNLTPSTARIVSLSVDGHRAVVIYENIKQRRLELKLVEFYTEHHAIDRLAPLKKMLPFGSAKTLKQSSSGDEGALKIYDETFVLDLPDVSAVVFTQTLKRVTPQTLILHSEGTEKLYQIPHRQFSARRWLPPAASELEKDLSMPDAAVDADAGPYEPLISPIPIAFVPPAEAYNLKAVPSGRESETLITIGNQTIPFRPAAIFDSLPTEFSHAQVALSVLSLLVGVIFMFTKTIRNRRKLF